MSKQKKNHNIRIQNCPDVSSFKTNQNNLRQKHYLQQLIYCNEITFMPICIHRIQD